MEQQVNSKVGECDVQVNMTYQDTNDLIWAIANPDDVKAKEILSKFKAVLNDACKTIDGE